jgi:hypothetical protein
MCLLGTCVIGASAAGEPSFEVGTWGNFCRGAFTHTFDDNTPNQTKIAQPLFDARGFHITLFAITGSSQLHLQQQRIICHGSA